MRATAVFVLCFAAVAAAEAQTSIATVQSADGTPIAFECAGAGPSLVIVHGGTGDRTRWTPLFPLLAPHFRVCAMDRRAHGASGDAPSYSLLKEVEDVIAVVEAQPRPVFVLGHSFGAVCAFEAAFHTTRIEKLALYESPVIVGDHSATLARMRGAGTQRDGRDSAGVRRDGLVVPARAGSLIYEGRLLIPSSASRASIRRRSNTHNVQTKAQPTAISDAPIFTRCSGVIGQARMARIVPKSTSVITTPSHTLSATR